MISGVGAVLAILFALLILAKKKKSLPDWILFFWFVVFSAHLFCGLGHTAYPSIKSFEVFVMTIGFLHGPFFLLYSKSLVYKNLRWVDSIHFLPFFFFTVLGFFVQDDFKARWQVILLIPKIISLVAYPAYVYLQQAKRITYWENNHSDSTLLALRWIKMIALLFLLSIGIGIIRLVVELATGVPYFELWDVLRYVLLLTAMGFFGLQYGMVYRPEYVPSILPEDGAYKHSPLKKGEIEKYANMILNYIEDKQPFLDPNFSLTALSEATGIRKHHLSQIISSEMNTSFYNLINSKRVAYALHRLKTEGLSKLTFEGLGYESGFNTKSSFYYNFKKVTGKTPKQYLKEIGGP
ncbi:MAG: helix-turn-helix domain-containing protein [Bacteroidota bacterium]